MAELNTIHKNGGARPGAGRPKGSTTKLNVTDFFNGKERDQLVLEAKLLAFGDGESKPDKDMIKFLWEQLFGKATQKTELSGADGAALQIVFDKALKGE